MCSRNNCRHAEIGGETHHIARDISELVSEPRQETADRTYSSSQKHSYAFLPSNRRVAGDRVDRCVQRLADGANAT